MDKCLAAGRGNSEPLAFPHALPSTTLEKETKGSLYTLKLDLLFSERQRAVRQMMPKHRSVCNGQLGKTNTL